MKDYQRKRDKVIFIGKGYEWWNYPRDKGDEYEYWSINDVISKELRVDLMFNPHYVEDYGEAEMLCTKLASHLGIPIMMPKEYDHLPTSIRFPIEQMKAEFDTDYFMTGISWMFAYAISKGYKQIDCYGVNMRGEDERYKNARACVEAWIFMAKGKGIKVNMIGKYCDCLKTFDRRIYGFNDLQTMPYDINDRALFVTFACSLDRQLIEKVYRWLSVQKGSKYFLNFQPIPVGLPDLTYLYNVMRNLVTVHGDGSRFVGDCGFYPLLHFDSLINTEHSAKFVIFEGDKDKSVADWLSFAEQRGVNPWTNQKSEFFNGDKPGDEAAFFPKYDLPKEAALRKFHDDYYTVAARSKFKFPGYVNIYKADVLDEEEGKRNVLRFLGYKDEEMVMEIPDKAAPIPQPLCNQIAQNPEEYRWR